MGETSGKYIHAMRWDFLTKLYDPMVQALGHEWETKTALIEQAAVDEGHRVLDLACGTATLTM